MTSHPTEPKLPESLEVVAWLLAYPDGGIGFYLDGCVAWPDELRANMAASSHIATGPSVPVVRLTDAESALKARDAEIERLRGVIVETRRVLEQENNKGDASAIQDTIWRGLAETLFDYLDAAIDQARDTGGEKANG